MKSLILVVLILFPMFISAGEPVLTLDQAVSEVLSSNPDVHAAGYRTDAARARISQAKGLEDPTVGVMFDDVPRDTANLKKSEEIDYRVEQKFPFPGKRHVRGKVARLDAESVAEASRGQVRDVLLDLKKTYYEVYRIDRSLEVNRENQGLLQQLSGSTETAYAAGQTNAEAALKARVELSKIKNDALLLQQQRTTHLAHLKALLGRSTHEEVRLPTKLNWPRLSQSLSEVVALAQEHRPELTAIRSRAQRDRASLTVARQGLIPDFSLGFQYGQRPMSKDTWAGTAMMNLPIPLWGKHRGEIREAKALLHATEAERQSMEVHTHHEIEQAYSAVKTSEQVVNSYQRELLPQVRANLAAARLAYGAKQADFLTLLDAARSYRDLHRDFYEQQAQLGISFAELERLVGRDL